MTYKDLNISLFIDKIKVIPDDFQENNSYFFLNTDYFFNNDINKKLLYLFKVIGILLLLVLLYSIKIYNNKKKKVNKKESIKISDEEMHCILNAEIRSDFEKIYIHKNNIEKIFTYNQNGHIEFFNKLSKIIFTKKWNSKDLINIKELYHKMDLKVKDGI